MTPPPRVPSADEVAALIAAMPRHTKSGARDRAAALLLADTGARPAELLSVFPGDLDLRGQSPSVATPLVKKRPKKGDATARYGKLRGVERARVDRLAELTNRDPADALGRMQIARRPISTEAAAAVEAWLERRKEIPGGPRPLAPLFVTTRGGVDRLAKSQGREPSPRPAGEPWTPSGLRLALASASRRAGLTSPVTARSLRHYCASRAYGSTEDLLHARDVLGHSTATTTEVYLRALGALTEVKSREWLEPRSPRSQETDELVDLLTRLEGLLGRVKEMDERTA